MFLESEIEVDDAARSALPHGRSGVVDDRPAEARNVDLYPRRDQTVIGGDAARVCLQVKAQGGTSVTGIGPTATFTRAIRGRQDLYPGASDWRRRGWWQGLVVGSHIRVGRV
jgi:hypothetical protein